MGEGGGRRAIELDPELEDVLFGLCPEDFSFSLHTSCERILSPRGHVTSCAEPRTSSSLTENEDKPLQRSDVRGGGSGGGGGGGGAQGGHYVYPSGTFFGLPMKVKECLKENRNIDQLYGE